MKINKNVEFVLKYLSGLPRNNMGDAWSAGEEIRKITNLSPPEINDVIEVATNRGWVRTQDWYGTVPYKFGEATITPEGRLLLESK